MFLNMMLQRNEELIRAAAKLHQDGKIPANTYVIDLDSLEKNVQRISQTAKDHDLNLYYMTKQIGRSGFVGQIIQNNGIERAVAVDIDEAIELKKEGCAIGNIGHLVQPSKSQWHYVLTFLRPEVVTLFSYERAKQLSDAAEKLGKKQDVLLRVIRPNDVIFPGQFGGFLLDDLEGQLDDILTLKGINVVGVTSFPIFCFHQEQQDFSFTPNIETLQKARNILERKGIKVTQVNAPGATSCYTIPKLKEAGVTHGEPGHAMTGTTPLHAYKPDLPEVPSIVYVSEISHMDDEFAYTIGGGFYARSNMKYALFGGTEERIIQQKAEIDRWSATNIDYYGCLKRKEEMKVGDTVIYAFRTQIFITRSHVAYIRGARQKAPELVYFQRRGQ